MRTKILIVDTCEENLKHFDTLLTKAGYECFTLSNPENTILTLEQHKPCLLLLSADLNSPTGFEVCSKVKSTASTKKVRVIFVSKDHCEVDDVLKGYYVGGVDYLPFPFSNQELIQKINVRSVTESMYAASRQYSEVLQNVLSNARNRKRTVLL